MKSVSCSIQMPGFCCSRCRIYSQRFRSDGVLWMRRQSCLARAEAMLHKESAISTPSEQGFVHRQAAHAGKMSERVEELRILKVRVMMHARTNILAKVSDLERHTSRILLAAIHSGSDHHHAYQRALYVSIDRISGGVRCVDYCKQASKQGQ